MIREVCWPVDQEQNYTLMSLAAGGMPFPHQALCAEFTHRFYLKVKARKGQIQSA